MQTITHNKPTGLAAMARDGSTLVKARLSLLVLATTLVGYLLADPNDLDGRRLTWTLVGTFLAAASASALNQAIERHHDARMRRTADRPVAAGRLSRPLAVVIGFVLGYTGCAVLAMQANLLSAGLAALTIVLYAAAYTPLKRLTTFNTVVGAVVGAVPPLIGWAAAADTLQRGAWVLAALLFTWQLPHFFALAWLHREDYERGGFRMLPSAPGGELLAAQTGLLASLLLVPIGLMATLLGLAGIGSAIATTAAGLGLSWFALRHLQRCDAASARNLFLASLAYLPLVLVAMSADRGPITGVAGTRGGRVVVQEVPAERP
jgi:protoheme IX farnesyltransferase